MRQLLGRFLHQASILQRPVSSSLCPSILLTLRRCTHDERKNNSKSKSVKKLAEARKLLPNRYKVFDDKETEIVFDDTVDLDVILNQKQKKPSAEKEAVDRSAVVGLRGVKGVFDIEELVTFLREENMVDIATIKVPEELKYCEYMVICTAASAKHIKRFAETLNQLYKIKKHPSDPFLNLNDESKDWRLIDLENIVLNVFLEETRAHYDIETLWTVGEAYDEKLQRPEGSPVEDILQRHISFLEAQAKTNLAKTSS